MNKERIQELLALAKNAEEGKRNGWPFYPEALAKAMTPEVVRKLCEAAEHSLSAQDEVLTDEEIEKIAYDTGASGWIVVFAREIEKRILAAAPSPAVAAELPQFDFAKLMMYPEEWDTMAYPTLESAMWEIISCAQIQSAIDHERNAEKIATPSPSLAVRDAMDAARYRWLRDKSGADTATDGFWAESKFITDITDEAIDTAMKGQP